MEHGRMLVTALLICFGIYMGAAHAGCACSCNNELACDPMFVQGQKTDAAVSGCTVPGNDKALLAEVRNGASKNALTGLPCLGAVLGTGRVRMPHQKYVTLVSAYSKIKILLEDKNARACDEMGSAVLDVCSYLVQTNRPKFAIRIMAQFLQSAPSCESNPAILLLLAHAYTMAQNSAQTRETLQSLIAKYPLSYESDEAMEWLQQLLVRSKSKAPTRTAIR